MAIITGSISYTTHTNRFVLEIKLQILRNKLINVHQSIIFSYSSRLTIFVTERYVNVDYQKNMSFFEKIK